MRETFYWYFGGIATVSSASTIFYQKVLDNAALKRFFVGKDAEQVKAIQQAFLSLAFGQPSDYASPKVKKAMEVLFTEGLYVSDLEIIVALLDNTLSELGVPRSLIADAVAIVETNYEGYAGRVARARAEAA